jgi:hypothetical protein
MKGKIVLEEHLTTALNNSIWDASGESARNGKAYMDDVEVSCWIPNDASWRWINVALT